VEFYRPRKVLASAVRARTLTLAAAALCGAAPAFAASCEDLATTTLPYATITAAATVTGGTFTPPTGAAQTNLPDFCRVALTLAPTADSNIRVEVWMPAATWNNRFQGLGGGGYTGTLNYGALADALRLNYAAAHTDMGTSPATTTNGVPVVGHPEKQLDFGSRSTHMMTVAAKSLVQAYYGREPDRSYFVGCSTGGHQGFAEAQVFPSDYDGIVAGAPGHNRTHLHAAFVSDWVVSHKAPGSVVSAAKLSMLNTAVLNACRGLDGGLATDNFLHDPRACNFDPGVLQCRAGDAPDCLTASELVTVRHHYAGLRNPTTLELIYPGWPLGSELGWGSLQGGATAAFPGILNWAFGASYDPLTLSFDTATSALDALLAPAVNFMSTDLSRFVAKGGKLLVYHGLADAIVSPQDTMTYFERLAAEQGQTPQQVQSYARLFLAPGMGHCSGGNGPNTVDYVSPLVNWVETGAAPERLVATKYVNNNASLGVQMTRPLCVYPLEARYGGSGDVNSAANWVCVDDGNTETVPPLPAPEYLSPLKLQARVVPDVINMRAMAGVITVLLTTAPNSADLRQWMPSDVKAEGASAMNVARTADGRGYLATFRRSDLASFTGGKAAGKPVDLMLTGTLLHDGVQSLFAVSATVKVIR